MIGQYNRQLAAMLLLKVFECTLTLSDPADIYACPVEKAALALLSARFKGKTYKSHMIVEVVRVVRASERIANLGPGVSFNISVEFEARCLIYTRGELVPHCKIVRLGDAVFATAPYTSIEIWHPQPYFVVGNEYPLISVAASYGCLSSTVALICVPFVPQYVLNRAANELYQKMLLQAAWMLMPDDIWYKIEGGAASLPSSSDVTGLLLDIAELKKTIASAPPVPLAFFRKLFSFGGPNNNRRSSVDIIELAESHGGAEGGAAEAPVIVSRAKDVAFDDPRLVRWNESGQPAEPVISIPMCTLLNMYKHNLLMLSMLVNAYPTPAAIENNIAVWNTYKRLATA